MSQPFDPYHVWLGISPNEQPANHYRLLGIPLYEPNPDVIESAADRQMKHLRTFQTGPHSAASQRLLGEVSKAQICLLNRDQKQEYDQQLRAKLTPPPAPVAAAAIPIAPAVQPVMPLAVAAPAGPIVDSSKSITVRRTKAKSSPPLLTMGIGLAATAALVTAVVWFNSHEPDTIAAAPSRSETDPTQAPPLIKPLDPEETVPATGSPESPAWEAELLRNGGCEEPMVAGSIPGWSVVRGRWFAQSATRDNRIVEGQHCFYAGNAATGQLYQDVDIGGFAAGIDSGKARVKFSGQTFSYVQKPPDTWRVLLEFRGANELVLDSHDTGDQTSPGRWSPLEVERLVPKETRSIRVTLHSRRRGANTKSNDAKFDALSLRLFYAEEQTQEPRDNSP